jgi:hypothetical protein
MEKLEGIIHKATQNSRFLFHWRCKKNAITHLYFANDLMIYHADQILVEILKTFLDTFAGLSSLSINPSKNSLYLSSIYVELQSSITTFLGIQHKALPVKYLGVPLITTRLTQTDCISLVERIISRIKLWTSSSLTKIKSKVAIFL